MEKPNPGSPRVQIRPSCPTVTLAMGAQGIQAGVVPRLQGRTARLSRTASILRAFQSVRCRAFAEHTGPGAGWGRRQGCPGGTGLAACSPETHSPVGETGTPKVVEIREMSLAGKQKSTSPAAGGQ